MGKEQNKTPARVAGGAKAQDSGARAAVELDAMLMMGRRNLDALSAVRDLTVDCIYQCADRQAQAWNALCQGTFDLMVGGVARPPGMAFGVTPSPALAEIVETALAHLRDLSEIIARTNHGALDLIHNRSDAYLREIETVAGAPDKAPGSGGTTAK